MNPPPLYFNLSSTHPPLFLNTLPIIKQSSPLATISALSLSLSSSPSKYNHHNFLMSRSRETNPHFHPQQELEDGIVLHFPPQQPRRHHHHRDPQQPQPSLTPHSPGPRQPHRQTPRHHTTRLQPPDSPSRHPPTPSGQPEPHPNSSPHRRQPDSPAHNGRPHRHATQPGQSQQQQSPPLRVPPPQKTRPHTWLIGVVCALLWIAVFLGGLVVLIVYLLFRPRSPKFEVSNASLNAAYLDMGYLLNADMTLLANFTNPSKKATVDFSTAVIQLYYGNTLIATSYIDPFSEMKAEYKIKAVHLISSQVWLNSAESQRLTQQMSDNKIIFEVKGLLRTRSSLGTFFRYSYWLYGHCKIAVTGPPSGILVAKRCKTKR